jgi:hypothetical protein
VIDPTVLSEPQRHALEDVELPVTVAGDQEHRRGKGGMAHAFTCATCGRLLASDDPDALRAAAIKHVDKHAA